MPHPPPLPGPADTRRPSALAIVLSLALVVFLTSAALGVFDDTLLLFDRRELSGVRALAVLLALLVGVPLFLMMAVFPRIPKRFFMPVALFIPVTSVAVLPLLVYFHEHARWIGLAVSLIHLALALWIPWRLRRGGRIAWPLVDDSQLAARPFRWGHFASVTATGALVIAPLLAGGVLFSAKLAVDHFSAGFVAIKPSGVSMQVRRYVRDDGRSVWLVPMSHVGESSFYQNLSASFPQDAVVLMEGVSDQKRLLPRDGGYSKMAEAIGVVEQQEAFKPPGRLVAADMDMSEFSPATIEMLKTAMMIHSKGLTAETLPHFLKPAPEGLERKLFDDILTKRNRHLLKILHDHLPQAAHIVVPWGAAHMPEIAREIEKSGFRVEETRDFMAIRFGS
jgi:hypothetical protein